MMTRELLDAECDAIVAAINNSDPWSSTLQLARKYVRAAYAAGAAEVPREPTRGMCAAAATYALNLEDHAIMTYANIWRAMHDAATGEKK